MRDSDPVRKGIAVSGMSRGLKIFCVHVTRVVPGPGQVTGTDVLLNASRTFCDAPINTSWVRNQVLNAPASSARVFSFVYVSSGCKLIASVPSPVVRSVGLNELKRRVRTSRDVPPLTVNAQASEMRQFSVPSTLYS